MSRSRDYVDGVPCEIAERIVRKRKRKKVKPFRRRDDDLKVVFQTGTKQSTLADHPPPLFDEEEGKRPNVPTVDKPTRPKRV